MTDKDSTEPPRKRPVAFKSKKQIREGWAKLDLPDLEDSPPPTEVHAALDELFQDDLHDLSNE